jgi:uncharacterized membrane protein YgdD (TMEM256/DUF423 family)
MSKFLTIAAVLGFVGVVFGAFGAHGLEDRLISNGHLDTWQTATFYLFVHVLALFVLATGLGDRISGSLCWIGWFWTVGILIFSGSLYILAITDLSKLGMIAPFGGGCFLAGWGILAWFGYRNKRKSVENS